MSLVFNFIYFISGFLLSTTLFSFEINFASDAFEIASIISIEGLCISYDQYHHIYAQSSFLE